MYHTKSRHSEKWFQKLENKSEDQRILTSFPKITNFFSLKIKFTLLKQKIVIFLRTVFKIFISFSLFLKLFVSTKNKVKSTLDWIQNRTESSSAVASIKWFLGSAADTMISFAIYTSALFRNNMWRERLGGFPCVYDISVVCSYMNFVNKYSRDTLVFMYMGKMTNKIWVCLFSWKKTIFKAKKCTCWQEYYDFINQNVYIQST